MPARITFALVGDPSRPFTEIESDELTRPWAERPKVELDVDEGDSVANVIARALERFEVPLPDYVESAHHVVDLAFFTDTEPRGYSQVGSGLTLIDENGRATWNVYELRLVQYGELLRAGEAGALPGDPTRVHLVLREGVGNGEILDWPTVLQAWEVAWQIAERVAVAGGVAAATKLVVDAARKRLRRGHEVATREAPAWDRRNGLPYVIKTFLESHPWSLQQLAALLGCSMEDAEAVLEVFGYSEGHDGLWHPRADEAGVIVATVFEEIQYLSYPTSELESEFRNQIESLLTTGQASPRPDPPEVHYSDHVDYEREQRKRAAIRVVGIAAAAFIARRLFGRR